MSLALPGKPSLLVIRRDNIGDLLCTTPLIAALRARHPEAWIGVLANSYNAPVLAGNPHLDAVLDYDKGKHVDGLAARLGALGRRLALVAGLRRRRLDAALLPASGHQASAERFARLSGAAAIVRQPDGPAPEGAHEVEIVFRLAAAFGIEGPPPPMTLVADPGLAAACRARLPAGTGPVVALHISARKPRQRWPAARYAELARRLHRSHGARFLLFWAPGPAGDPRHPGDDEQAAALAASLADLPLLPVPTGRLAEMIAGLSLCDAAVCSDGGAMHVAAALGKPLLCFFGNSDARRWHPWVVPHRLLQPASRDAADISTDEAEEAFRRLVPPA